MMAARLDDVDYMRWFVRSGFVSGRRTELQARSLRKKNPKGTYSISSLAGDSKSRFNDVKFWHTAIANGIRSVYDLHLLVPWTFARV
jgi:hypothetical protein